MSLQYHEILFSKNFEISLGIFNLRGSDIPFNPVFFSYGLITEMEAVLYINKEKLSSEVGKKFCF